MKELAAQLGSDCSFFVEDKPMLGIGRGEQLSALALNLKGYYLVLVKPEIHVSTAEAYGGVKPKLPDLSISEILAFPVDNWKDYLVNDFEESVFKRYPPIEAIKKELYEQGAVYAAMSGSGSSVFGIFQSKTDLSSRFAGAQYWSGYLN